MTYIFRIAITFITAAIAGSLMPRGNHKIVTAPPGYISQSESSAKYDAPPPVTAIAENTNRSLDGLTPTGRRTGPGDTLLESAKGPEATSRNAEAVTGRAISRFGFADAESAAPIKPRSLRIDGYEVAQFVGNDGIVELAMETGEHYVEVEAEGYESLRARHQVLPARTIVNTFELVSNSIRRAPRILDEYPASYHVFGWVRAAEDRSVIPFARVMFRSASVFAEATADDRGEYSLYLPADAFVGDWQLRADAPSREGAELNGTGTGDTPTEFAQALLLFSEDAPATPSRTIVTVPAVPNRTDVRSLATQAPPNSITVGRGAPRSTAQPCSGFNEKCTSSFNNCPATYVETVPTELYVKRVLYGELPGTLIFSDAKLEAFKALAVAIRSYASYREDGHELGSQYSICNSDYCQCYYSGFSSFGPTTIAASDQTAGQTLVNASGSIVLSEYGNWNGTCDRGWMHGDPNGFRANCSLNDTISQPLWDYAIDQNWNLHPPAADCVPSKGLCGHARGMSQYGAHFRAKDNFTYQQILEFYYQAYNWYLAGSPSNANVGGTVTNASTGGVIVGANVAWAGNLDTTGSAGTYYLSSVTCQTAPLTITKTGYKTYSQSYTPGCLASNLKNVALTPDALVCSAGNVFGGPQTTSTCGIPTVTTTAATSVLSTSATFNATVNSDGGSAILERRFDWGVYPNWTNATNLNGGTIVVSGSNFSYSATGLSPDTLYQFRGWARNSAGWALEGNGLAFRTAASSPGVCTTFTINPTNASPSSAAGPQVVTITGSAPSGCQGGTWNASESSSWLTVSPTSGSGSGSTTVAWSQNTSTASRSDSATIAGKTFSVTQAGATPATCTSFTISPSSASPSSAGSSQYVTITGSPSGCQGGGWSTSESSSWLSISPTSGTGSGSTTVAWTQNQSTSSRSDSATIAGRTFSVTQSGTAPPTCTSFTINPSSASPPSAGGSQYVTITGSPSGCQGGGWSISESSSWLSASPTSGTGSGSTTVTWTQNSSTSSRSDSATIASRTFSVTQSGTNQSGGGGEPHPFIDVTGAIEQVHGLARGPDGSVYVLYRSTNPKTLNVVRSSDGGLSWNAPTSVPNSTFSNSDYDFTIDPGGTIHVVWSYSSGGTDTYYSKSTNAGASFSSPIVVRTGNTYNGYRADNATEPVVAADGFGNVYVAYGANTRDGSDNFAGYNVWVSKSTNGGNSFQPEFSINTISSAQKKPKRITATPSNFYVLYVDQTNDDLYFYRRNAGAAPGNTGRLNTNAGSVQYDGDFAVAPNEMTIYAAYSDETGDSEGNISFCKSTDGGISWPACTRVNDSTRRSQHSPDVGLDGLGGLHTAWTDLRSGSTWRIYYAYSADGGVTFSPNVSLSDLLTDNDFTQPRLVVDDGNSAVYVSATRDISQVVVARLPLTPAPPEPPPSPTGVAATAVSSTQVNITWTPATGVTGYQIDRKAAGGGFSQIGTSTLNSYSDTTASADSAYLYRVRAVSGAGVSSASTADLATTMIFADTPLEAGNKPKSIHVTQLRIAINAVRVLGGLNMANYTNGATASTVIRALDLAELRSALDASLTALGLATGGYTDAASVGVTIKAVHLQELRDRLR